MSLGSGLLALAPGRDAAADAARRELTRPQYEEARPALLVRVLARALEALEELLSRLSGLPGGGRGALLAGALLAALVALLLVRLGPLRRRPPAPGLFAGAAPLTAQGHRAAAEEAARPGRWDEAVRERMRAVVRGLEERGLVDERPGRTAREAAAEAGAALPEHAASLAAAAGTFEQVWYGGRAAVQDDDARLRDVDAAVRGARAGSPARPR